MVILPTFLPSFWFGLVLRLTSHPFIHIQRETTSTFYIIPAFPPFSPSIINLFHHLAGELVFPLRQHVILPTHHIKRCPCSTITLRLCPLPAHNASVHFKPKSCAVSLVSLRPRSPPGFPRHVSFRVKGCCSFTKIYSHFYFVFVYFPAASQHALNWFWMQSSCVKKHGRKKQWMDGSAENTDVWMNRHLIWNQCETGDAKGQEGTRKHRERCRGIQGKDSGWVRSGSTCSTNRVQQRTGTPGTLRNPSNTLYSTFSAATQLDMCWSILKESVMAPLNLKKSFHRLTF